MTQRQTPETATPADLGFAMPAEWSPHEATWLAWPHHQPDWPGKMEAVRWVYGEMIRKISPGETVRLLVRHRAEQNLAADCLKRAGCELDRVEFITHPTNRGWMRDSGPIFVRRPSPRSLSHRMGEGGPRHAGPGEGKTETAIVHFHFNAWARHDDWQKDRRVPEMAARRLRRRLFQAECNGRPFVLEGGGIEVNGSGTLLTTEQCYLHPRIQVRNPGLTRGQYEETFKKYLGVRNVFWLRKGPAGDDTHGHIDDICRFVNRKTLVLIRETNRRDVNYRPLAENWERIRDLRLEDGTRPEIVPLPMPAPLCFNGNRLPASYANFYIANAGVIVPTFNDPNDRVALGILGELFRDRPVAGIHAVDLVLGSGSLHCLTQQQPG
ncbi:MAG TPA: agmatine deiminase family protein [Candidatus Acidoferrum sp.]|nr:agmatine deiminase family protein [Candidatus Acidoferrum sp.]